MLSGSLDHIEWLSGYDLRASSWNGNLKDVKRLLDKGVNINAKCQNSWTPLHNASYYGRSEVVSYLIERGADVNCQNNTGMTPIHLACLRGNDDIVNQLLSAFADLNIRDLIGETPLDTAERSCKRNCASLLRYHQHRRNWLLFYHGITPNLTLEDSTKATGKLILISDLNRFITEFL